MFRAALVTCQMSQLAQVLPQSATEYVYVEMKNIDIWGTFQDYI